MRIDAEAIHVVERDTGPRWRIEPGGLGGAYSLIVDGAKGPAPIASGDSEDLSIVRAAGKLRLGDQRVQLAIDDRVIWQGKLRVISKLEEDPVVLDLRTLRALPGPWWLEISSSLPEKMGPWQRARMARWMGKQALQNMDPELARALWLQGAGPQGGAHAPKSSAQLLRAAAYLDVGQGELASAEGLIERAERILISSGQEVGSEEFEMRAMIEWRRGRPEAAIRMSQEALRRALRNGDAPARARIQQALGVNLVQAGRYEAGLEMLALAVKDSTGSDEIFARANEAWALLRATEAGLRPERWSEHRSRLKGLLPVLKDGSYAAVRAEVLAELVYVELRSSELDSAQAWMTELKKVDPSQRGASAHFVALVRAQLAIETGDIAVAKAQLATLVRQLGSTDRVAPDELSALALLSDLQTSRAKKIRTLRRAWTRVLAAADYLEAPDSKSHYFHLARQLPMRLARALSESGQAEAGAQVLLEARQLLLTELAAAQLLAKEPDLYASVVRRRRSAQAKSSLDCEAKNPTARQLCQRDKVEAKSLAVQVSHDFFAQLPHRNVSHSGLGGLHKRLKSGQAVLISQSDGPDRIYFLVTAKDTYFASGEVPEAWARRFEKLSRLYAMGHVDLGALQTPSGPLAAQVEVVQFMPVQAQAQAQAPSSWGPSLVLVDPNSNLPKSRAQGLGLAKTVGGTLLVGAQARRASVRTALRHRPDLFVHIGHGAVADRAHWSTQLTLMDGDLDAFSILTEGLGADLVVLAGCSTGATDGGQGLGLPEVFILGGAYAVLATVSSVQDGDAVPFVQRFLSAGAQTNPARAFKIAVQQSVVAGDPTWRQFRLWVRE